MTTTELNGGASHCSITRDEIPPLMNDEDLELLNIPDEDDDDDKSDLDMPLQNPLQHEWSIWYLRNDRAKLWTDRLTRVKSVATVEEFWAVINYTTPASKITVGCEYYLFKSNIQPMWEDPANRNGGRWVTVLDKSLRFTRLDHYWLETLLLLIGEGFGDFSETVCGAVVQLRGKGDKLSIWTSHYDEEEAVRSVGRTWKERLMLKGPISYQKHEDQQTKSSSMLKSLFTL